MSKLWGNTVTTGAGGSWHTLSVTLPAEGWQGSHAPFSCALALAGVTGTSVQILAPAAAITAQQLFELQEANIQDGGQTDGQLTLLAYGKKPESDLPLQVMLWRED